MLLVDKHLRQYRDTIVKVFFSTPDHSRHPYDSHITYDLIHTAWSLREEMKYWVLDFFMPSRVVKTGQGLPRLPAEIFGINVIAHCRYENLRWHPNDRIDIITPLILTKLYAAYWVLFQYPMRRLIVRSRKVFVFRITRSLWNLTGTSGAVLSTNAKMSKRCDNLNYQFHGF